MRRRRTPYACLSIAYYRDEAITECSPLAELLFVRSMAFCREQGNDGKFTDAQLDYIAVRLPKPQKLAAELVSAGVWERLPKGYNVRSFIAWNPTTEEIQEAHERDRERKRAERNPDSVRADKTRTRDGIRAESETSPDGFLIREERKKKEEELSSAQPPRADVESLCRRLADAIEANGSKRPAITEQWRASARLLLDRDEKPLAEALRLVAWCQDDDFWRTNILSMPTFRKQYDKLRLKAGSAPRPTPKNPNSGLTAEWLA